MLLEGLMRIFVGVYNKKESALRPRCFYPRVSNQSLGWKNTSDFSLSFSEKRDTLYYQVSLAAL
jgi:hypothetical protein